MDPKAKPNLLVEEVLDETLVYDLDGHRAHCLNAPAGFLLRNADGTRSVEDLVAMARSEFGADTGPKAVEVGLERLRRAGLIEWDGARRAVEGIDRRRMLKQLAAIGVVLPTVLTLASPFPAQAATGLGPAQCDLAHVGACCTSNRTCVQMKSGAFKCQGPVC